ncbi:collagen-binding domain-containing protein [Arthrobacter sp. RAF14]|uniref:collagen-binding domain-containing protein n=1 Tax=Arthrobacter sp. RAF14 TaxID=3233051 RepID=UPI003F92A9CC
MALTTSAALLGAGFLNVTAAQAESTTTGRFNPLAEYSDWNVVSFGDTTVHAESEGAVATAGKLRFANTNIAFKSTSSIALLTGGQIDFGASAGQLQINNSGSVKVGDLSNATAMDTDQNGAQVNTQVVPTGSAYGSTPAVAANHRQAAGTVSAPGLFSRTFSQARANSTSRAVADAATAQCNAERVITPSAAGGRVSLSMTPGVNYWNVSAQDLSSLREITFSGPVSPSPSDPLVVNVSGGAEATLNLTMAGTRDPQGILFNLPGITSITQSGDSIDGSLLAPNATYLKKSANLQGTAIVAEADLAGSEEHYYPFSGYISSCGETQSTAPATSPAPSVTESPSLPATEAPATTTPATTAPGVPRPSETAPAPEKTPGSPTPGQVTPSHRGPSEPTSPGTASVLSSSNTPVETTPAPSTGELARTGAPGVTSVLLFLGGGALFVGAIVVLRFRARRS